MPTVSNPKSIEPCFGVGCPHHSTCARYEAVNGATEVKRGTCLLNGQFVKYIPLIPNGQSLLF